MTDTHRQSGLTSFTTDDTDPNEPEETNATTETDEKISDGGEPPEQIPDDEDVESTDSGLAEAKAIAGMNEPVGNDVEVHTPSGVPEQATETTQKNTDLSDVSAEEIADSWGSFFPHETPYDQQIDAIEKAIDVLDDRGYLSMEGACGTGKTIIALAASIYLSRQDDTEFTRTVVGTPVKQQLKQFVEEIRDINANIANSEDVDAAPASAVVLVGKHELHPYMREGKLNNPDVVKDDLSDLRERTVELVKNTSLMSLDWPDHLTKPCADCSLNEVPINYTYCDACEGNHPSEDNGPTHDDGPWYDPVRAEALAYIARERTDDTPRLTTAGVETPYGETPPSQELVVNTSETMVADLPFDPFYAGFLANDGQAPFSANDGEHYVLDVPDLVENAAAEGVCPHESMADLGKNADVCVGNYNHIFDPETRKLTGEKMGILGEKSLVIIDEAHMLEERVRDMLSDSIGLHTLKVTYNDFGSALNALNGSDPEVSKTAYSVLNQLDIKKDELEEAREFTKWVGDYINEEVTSYLEEEHGDWEAKMRSGRLPNWDMEIPLRDPGDPSVDRMTEEAQDEGFSGKLWANIDTLGRAVEMIHDRAEIDREPDAGDTCEMLHRWYVEDHNSFFREIELERAPKDSPMSSNRQWTEDYNGVLTLYNCIPSEKLADIFSQLGGGVVMSATLQPMDIYTDVSGLDRVAETGRPVETASYGLQFPVENRASWIVDAPRFTNRNRGKPTSDYTSMTTTRQKHGRVLQDVACSHGNVLICMPSYAEAEWAESVLSQSSRLSKDVHLDESSSREETNVMLDAFFDEDDYSVMVTSTRGTVTEGVDYDGEKLHTCAVFGIPIVNVGSPRMKAVIQAYGETFGEENDFEYALTVPAVRKARQAIGRVIRGETEVGTRMLVDERYTEDAFRSVHEHLAPSEQQEFKQMSEDFVQPAMEQFWNNN